MALKTTGRLLISALVGWVLLGSVALQPLFAQGAQMVARADSLRARGELQAAEQLYRKVLKADKSSLARGQRPFCRDT